MTSAHRSSPVDLVLAPLHRQSLRIRRSALAVLSSAGVVVVLLAMTAAGMLGRRAMLIAVVMILVVVVLTFALLLTGANRRLADPSLTAAQTLTASTVLFWVAFNSTPHGHALALMLVPIAFCFASFRFGFKPLLMLASAIVVMAQVEASAREWFAVAHPLTPEQHWTHLAALAVSLLTLAIVGGQFNDLRRRNRAERAVSHVAMSGLSEAVMTVDRHAQIRFMNTAARQLFACDDPDSALPALDQVCRFIDRRPLSHELVEMGAQLDNPIAAVSKSIEVDIDSRHDLTLMPAGIAAQIGEFAGSLIDDPAEPMQSAMTGKHTATGPGPGPGLVGGMIERETGVFRYVRLSVSPLHSERGVLEGFVLMVRDLSETRRLMSELKHAATHDSLTGLLNRRGFMATLQQTLNASRYDDHPGAIVVIDLDQFKIVNDTCGHDAGDVLLRTVANLMAGLTPPGAALARLGGDEFGLVLRGVPQREVEALSARIIHLIAEARFGRENRVFRIGASIGVSMLTAETADSDTVLARADAACYLAKQRGRNCVRVYTPSDQEIARHQADMGWGRRIANALKQDQFALYLQRIVPVIAVPSRAERYEVLVRMIGADGVAIEPASFLPAAERFSQIGAIDRHVVTMAIAALASLAAQGKRLPHLSINLSPTSLRDPELLGWIGKSLREQSVPGGNLTFELTETAAIFDLDQALHFFSGLRQMGCRIALDDVGSGFNSFSNLRRLPIDQIKIDGAYVRGAADNPLDLVMVESIQRIAAILEVETVAEFVETSELRALMTRISIDHLQGYELHRPEPIEAVMARLPAAREVA